MWALLARIGRSTLQVSLAVYSTDIFASQRPRDVRRQLQDNDMPTQDEDDLPGDDDYRQTYNFAPSSYGLVYRLDAPDYGTAGSQRNNEEAADDDAANTTEEEQTQNKSNAEESPISSTPKYKLQPMRWGLIPFWTKRTPDYTTTMRTINCRDDSLFTPGGMWNTMKQNKRCIVIAQGFYEWLKKPNPGPSSGSGSSSKDVNKIPHFVKRKDGQLMCFAGLFDHVKYEDSPADQPPLYTYTIITTESNKQLSFLHDRMPVILDNGSADMFTWLDNAGRSKWSDDLQKLLKPYQGELECYPVSKEVGKVGNNSPSFIVPIDSVENKQNIMNFFGGAKKAAKTEEVKREVEEEEKEVVEMAGKVEKDGSEDKKTVDVEVNEENNAPLPVPASAGSKRERDDEDDDKNDADEDTHVNKAVKPDPSPSKHTTTPANIHKRSRNAMSNHTQEKAAAKKVSPNKSNAAAGTKKITSFFGK